MWHLYTITRTGIVILLCFLVVGCDKYSKEQRREIDAVKDRISNNRASIDRDDGEGTALEFALANGYMDLAEWLLERHAGVNAIDHDEGTAIHRAVIEDHTPKLTKLNFLLDHGARVDARRKGVETPLHLAVFLGRLDVVNLLLDHGADIRARSRYGQTPIHLACFPQGYPEIVNQLLARGAEINERQNDRATPLHLAAMTRNAAIVKLLLERGADLRLADSRGATALHYAAQAGNHEAVSLLLAHGADANARDFDDHTPLWWAVNQPAVTAAQDYSGPVDTQEAAALLRSHEGRE
jgi:ankyrin repeat protein